MCRAERPSPIVCSAPPRALAPGCDAPAGPPFIGVEWRRAPRGPSGSRRRGRAGGPPRGRRRQPEGSVEATTAVDLARRCAQPGGASIWWTSPGPRGGRLGIDPGGLRKSILHVLTQRALDGIVVDTGLDGLAFAPRTSTWPWAAGRRARRREYLLRGASPS